MRIHELDGLRGIAILAAMAEHSLSWLPAIGAQNGWLGVDLFFILTRRAGVIAEFLLSVLVGFAVAYGLWYGMESRILKWKDRNVPSPVHA